MFDSLPEPPKRQLTNDQKKEQLFQFAVVLNSIVLVYQIIHKLVLPLFVKWQAVADFASVHHLDGWWLYHLVLAILLKEKHRHSQWMKFWICFGFGGVALQTYISLSEYSWHVVSFWLTSSATIALLLFLMTIIKPKKQSLLKNIILILLGLSLGFFTDYALMGFKWQIQPSHQQIQNSEILKNIYPSLDRIDHCGLGEFTLTQKNFQNLPWTKSNQFQVKSCGFQPSLQIVDLNKALHFKNPTEQYTNIKLSYLEGIRWKSFKNIPLPAHASTQLEPSTLNHKVFLMFSDSNPKMGIVLFLATDHQLWDEKTLHQSIQMDRHTLEFFP